MEKLLLRLKEKVKEVIIYSGNNAFSETASFLNDFANKKIVISNQTIWNIWGEYFNRYVKDFYLLLLPDGEKYKHFNTVRRIYNFLVSCDATRKTLIIAFGGGVIGDLAGFVSSTYHRGMPLVHIPTTLLAQVDSSIGGKTGYNLKEGKNLIGTFFQPKMIISDPIFIETLPEKEFISGLAEVIKAGCIKDSKLFYTLENNLQKILAKDRNYLEYVIKRAQLVKKNVVERDEKEEGLRAILNFGHTLGHGIEVVKKWRVLHGYAVATGIAFATFMSYKENNLEESELLRILKLLKRVGYKLDLSIDIIKLEKALLKDKKKKEEHVEWVLLEKIGKAVFGIKLEMKLFKERFTEYKVYIKEKKSFLA